MVATPQVKNDEIHTVSIGRFFHALGTSIVRFEVSLRPLRHSLQISYATTRHHRHRTSFYGLAERGILSTDEW
jgi:hypothetical protein